MTMTTKITTTTTVDDLIEIRSSDDLIEIRSRAGTLEDAYRDLRDRLAAILTGRYDGTECPTECPTNPDADVARCYRARREAR